MDVTDQVKADMQDAIAWITASIIVVLSKATWMYFLFNWLIAPLGVQAIGFLHALCLVSGIAILGRINPRKIELNEVRKHLIVCWLMFGAVAISISYI